MTLPAAIPPQTPKARGKSRPRIAPPLPLASLLAEWKRAAADLGIDPMAWQEIAARYMTATRPDGRWLFRETCTVVARQNGKTEIIKPRVLMGLRRGERMLHTAQNRAIPRETFLEVAQVLDSRPENIDPEITDIRYANGQEIIKAANGGRYTLIAPRPGLRGNSVDTIFLDEVREQRSFDVIAALKPTMTASRNPQINHFSNAGDAGSVVLNDLRRRMDSDSDLAYLEWSTPPEYSLGDRKGWAFGNPALGITIQAETLAHNLRSLPPAVFETEHLCRWVLTMQPSLVGDPAWQMCRARLEKPIRPAMAISMDPSGGRASTVISWQQSDGTIALRVLADVMGSPINTDALGRDWKQQAIRAGATTVGFDPWTDADLARHFAKSQALNGREYANASENFARLITSGRLRWDDADAVSSDLPYAARKPHETGAWMAVKAQDDRPITAVFAAIRAVWLASGPKPSAPRVM